MNQELGLLDLLLLDFTEDLEACLATSPKRSFDFLVIPVF
jgi:hypothetical protein